MLGGISPQQNREGGSTSPAAPVVLGIGRGNSLAMNILAKPVNFLNEVRSELSKVAWSTRKELMASTILVITITAIMTIFIGIVDLGLSRFLSVVFK